MFDNKIVFSIFSNFYPVDESIEKYFHAHEIDFLHYSCATSISIFDISGFENVERNGFEQLCINFGCEKLQQLFNDHVFKREKEECESQGIDWIHIQHENNAEIVNLLEVVNYQLSITLYTLFALYDSSHLHGLSLY